MVSFGILAALAAVSFAVATPTEPAPCDGAVSPNPPAVNLVPLEAMVKEHHITNAERMRRGLGLNRPVFRKRGSPTRRESPPAPAPSAEAPAPATGPLCTGRTGFIRAHPGESRSDSDRWLSRNLNEFGEYGTTDAEEEALKVTLCNDNGDVFSIWTPNAPMEDVPFLGGISGAFNANDDFGVESDHYAYVGATVRVADGSVAVSGDNSFSRATSTSRNIESAVWSWGDNDSLTLSWVNADGSRLSAVSVRVVTGDDDSFVFTAGYSSYVNKFGSSEVWSFYFEDEF